MPMGLLGEWGRKGSRWRWEKSILGKNAFSEVRKTMVNWHPLSNSTLTGAGVEVVVVRVCSQLKGTDMGKGSWGMVRAGMENKAGCW